MGDEEEVGEGTWNGGEREDKVGEGEGKRKVLWG